MTLDHVELFVPDRRDAARWYERVIGLAVLVEHERWSDDPGGPLMISGDGGETKLALFTGGRSEAGTGAGFHRVAFRVGAAGFLRFLDRLPDLQLTDSRGGGVTREHVVDHEAAFSLYFCDPFGHHLELTTYDHETVRAAVRQGA